jgi:hypothetical protein
MRATPQELPQAWPREGTGVEEATRKGMEQIKQPYQPSHGALPGPHQMANRQSWGEALQPRMTDLPGEPGKGKVNVPFPQRMAPAVAKVRVLPVKDGKPLDRIWDSEGKK